MPKSPSLGITGATGSLGRRIANQLSARGTQARLIVRDPARTPQLPHTQIAQAAYLDRPALLSALTGIKTVFFVSGFEAEDRVRHHKAAIDTFIEAGVERVVYTSFLNAAPDATFTFARHHYETEEYLTSAGLSFTSLRNSLYLDILPYLVSNGEIRGPAGNGRFSPVSRDDISEVAVTALLDDSLPTSILDLTGPELVTMSDVAAVLSKTKGTPISFVNETIEEAYASRAHYKGKASDFEIEGWITSYSCIAAGELEIVSNTVERFTGHPSVSLTEFFS